MTTEQTLLVAVGALTSAVVFLFTMLVQVYRSVEARLMACETDRNKLWDHVYRLEAAARDAGANIPARPPMPPATVNLANS